MTQKSKQDIDFMPYWKKEEQCFEEAKIEGKDSYTGKKVSSHWPRDLPQAQIQYQMWLNKVKDPDTGGFYHKRDKDGNIIKGTGPRHIVRQIVRIRTNEDKEYLYSNGYLLGYDVLGEAVREICNNPETWEKVGFMYKKQYDEKSMTVKTKVAGPNSRETVYEMPFNEKNVKQLFEKRITPESARELGQKKINQVTFAIKNERNGVVRDVRDATNIDHKNLDLFLKQFDYLANSDYLTPEQKAQMRQRAFDAGLLPRDAAAANNTAAAQGLGTKPPSGTYS